MVWGRQLTLSGNRRKRWATVQGFPLVASNLVLGSAPPQEACMRACSSYAPACLIIVTLKPVSTLLSFHQINNNFMYLRFFTFADSHSVKIISEHLY